MQKGTGSLYQHIPGKKAVSFSGGHEQGIQKAAPDPVLRIRPDPHPAGDIVRRRKTDPADVLCQAIGIIFHDLIEARSVGLPDPRRVGAPDPVLLQEDHGVPEILFVFHLGADLPGDPKADALDLGQLLRLLLHDPQRIIAEFLYDPGCHGGADPLDASGCQIAVHGLGTLRRHGLIGLHP